MHSDNKQCVKDSESLIVQYDDHYAGILQLKINGDTLTIIHIPPYNGLSIMIELNL